MGTSISASQGRESKRAISRPASAIARGSDRISSLIIQLTTSSPRTMPSFRMARFQKARL
jgi:hypothetical protein